jgi:16S rRNA (cytosine1402-N4)-methyltransferase
VTPEEAKAHQPVMLAEALDALQLRAGGRYIDATFGRGGHSRAILARLGPDGFLLALDRDPEAVAFAREAFAGEGRFQIEHRSFGELAQAAQQHGMLGCTDGVLLDLGVSSPQLDDPVRGFGFGRPGPLDMRMDPTEGISAGDWLAVASEQDIATVLKDYGEERHARRIARRIVTARRQAPITTTTELAELVATAVPRWEEGKHPATRSFQAIRIFINGELQALEAALEQVGDVLAGGGRLVVISFHSLEDRLVKRFIRRESQGPEIPRGLPLPEARRQPTRFRPVGKTTRPGRVEVEQNPRARSAIMRVAERLS